MRGLIDQGRRAGRQSAQYLLPGSASLDLLKQSSETLAGRIAHLELAPFNILEASALPADDLWVRGGFPRNLLNSGNPFSHQALWDDNNQKYPESI